MAIALPPASDNALFSPVDCAAGNTIAGGSLTAFIVIGAERESINPVLSMAATDSESVPAKSLSA